ncbi:Peptidase family M1 [Dehalogenimonas formicexedens]|uniref:Peptidase family M1 n=1 Tax=Dehalogenimonas formicexedens TaxID=1839801 RepID=A0A1P8F8G2_9CHLR|nr:M1 family metallopeptidase [Dehalogenimonas formicexedens]APV44757.1 Peptidase family M1 [Dehalogenimonas formicexedens]
MSTFKNFSKPIVAGVMLVITACGCISPAKTTPTEVNWNDLSVYEANLIQGEHATLATMSEATVYHLDVSISPNFGTVNGHQEVRYINRETVELPSVYFRLFSNESGGQEVVSVVSVDGKPASFETTSSSSALKVTLPAALKPGDGITISLDFSLTLPLTTEQNFGLLGYFNGVLALDSFFPIIPVYDENGWHIEATDPDGDKTYNDAAFFQVNVTAPSNTTIVASGVEIARSQQENNQTITFADGPARDFYLVASNQLALKSTTVGETTVNSYYLQGKQNGADRALSTAVDAIRVFNNRFGIYPYTEFDIVPLALSGGGIGMEYPGIVGIGMSVYDNLGLLEETVAHETGHQWFYNLIGNDQVDQPWLDESLTQYVTGLYYLDIHGQDGWNASKSGWNSFWSRTLKAEIPIGMPVSSYPGYTYGSIIYGRGPLFLVALADFLGGPIFDNCLRGYCENFRWQVVDTASFEEWFQSRSGKDLNAIFLKWVLP